MRLLIFVCCPHKVRFIVRGEAHVLGVCVLPGGVCLNAVKC